MLSGPSFRSVFVLSINLLILPGFPSTSFHLAEASQCAVLMDLSKAFDYLPHDLLIAKLSAYGLSDEALAYIFSYLSGRKQSVKINNCYTVFQLILSGIP